ncbi:MAG TPA: hypothetical protein VIP11_09245 [Gemmatimonadaceae bacterium]
MNRVVLGWLFVIHALAHAAIGVWLAGGGQPLLLTLLWIIALVASLATGLAVLRFPILRHAWKRLLVTGLFSSSLLCLLFGGFFGLFGFAVNAGLFILAGDITQRRIDADIAVADSVGAAVSRHPNWLRAGWAIGLAALVYIATVAAIRPLYLRWGTIGDERVAALPGDDVLSPTARYRVDHAITIHAPARAVWPWLVQLGQDRGGFYSYDWLERAFGAHIQNADRVHPEWQQRAVGDTVFATQPSYFGGRLGKLGWRVSAIEPERAIVLEKWGAFVLRPLDSNTTRLIVRTREPGTVSVTGLLFSPFSVFVFEPAHFIMQRAMLRGIRDRAERDVAAISLPLPR